MVGLLECGGADLPALGALRLAVAGLELRRRIPSVGIRLYSLVPVPLPALGPEPVEGLAPEAVGGLGDQVDFLVLLGGPPGGPGEEKPEERGPAVPVGLPSGRVGHAESSALPALADRLITPDVARGRRRYLEVVNRVPTGGDYDLSVAPTASPGSVSAGPDVSVLDLVGLVASARSVVTASPSVAGIAASYGRPVTWAPAGPGAGPPGVPPELMSGRADAIVDRLAADVAAGLERAAAGSAERRAVRLGHRVEILESAYASLVAAGARERAALAAVLAGSGRYDERPPDGPWTMVTVRRLTAELESVTAERDRLRDELDLVYNTRTMRMLRPARRLYSRLRRSR